LPGPTARIAAAMSTFVNRRCPTTSGQAELGRAKDQGTTRAASIPGLPPELEQIVERKFMATTDNYAAMALGILLSGGTMHLTQDVRSGWSRFITSLALRNPESVERSKTAAEALFDEAREALEADYAKNRLPTEAPTYLEYAAKNSP